MKSTAYPKNSGNKLSRINSCEALGNISPRREQRSPFSSLYSPSNNNPQGIQNLENDHLALDLSDVILDFGINRHLENWIATKLNKIVNVKLQRCQLTQTPSLINQMINIRVLDISQNALTSFDRSICTLSNLIQLDMSNNLIAEINVEIINMKCLRDLNMRNNNLRKFICHLNLTKLDIDINPILELCSCVQSIPNLLCEWTQYLIPIQKGQKCRVMKMISYLDNLKESLGQLTVLACQKQSLGTIESLLQINTKLLIMQVKYQNNKSTIYSVDSLVHHCYRMSFMRSFKTLIEKGALKQSENLINNPQIESFLQLAVSRLDLEHFTFFVSIGQQITCLDEYGGNLLHILFSVFNKNPRVAAQIATKLLIVGIDPNQYNRRNLTPIHLAIMGEQNSALIWASQFNEGPGFPKFQFDKRGGDFEQGPFHMAANVNNPAILLTLENQSLSTLQENALGQFPRQISYINKVALKLLRKFEKNEIYTHFNSLRQEKIIPSSGIKIVPFIRQRAHRNSQSMQWDNDICLNPSDKQLTNYVIPKKLKFIQKDIQDSEPSLDDMVEQSPERKYPYAKGMRVVPISCEKTSLMMINGVHSQDVWQRTLNSPNLYLILNDLILMDHDCKDLTIIFFIANILMHRLQSKYFELRTSDQNLIKLLRKFQFLPAQQYSMRQDLINSNLIRNQIQIRELVVHGVTKLINQIHREATSQNAKIKLVQHPLLQLINPYLVDQLQAKFHQNIDYDISNPFNDKSFVNYRVFMNLMSLLQNHNSDILKLNIQCPNGNKLSEIHYESFQNQQMFKMIKDNPINQVRSRQSSAVSTKIISTDYIYYLKREGINESLQN